MKPMTVTERDGALRKTVRPFHGERKDIGKTYGMVLKIRVAAPRHCQSSTISIVSGLGGRLVLPGGRTEMLQRAK